MDHEYICLEKNGEDSAFTKPEKSNSELDAPRQDYIGVETTFLNDLITKRYSACSIRLFIALIFPILGFLIFVFYLYFQSGYAICTTVENGLETITTTNSTNRTDDDNLFSSPITTQASTIDTLQLVMLVDRSSEAVLQEIPRLVSILDLVSNAHKRAKYGLAFFSDFQCTDWWGAGSKHCETAIGEGGQIGHHDPEGCYTFSTGLTNDTENIKAKVQRGAIKYLPSGYYESGMAALMMTAADNRMGWSNFGKKVIIVITDDATHHWSKKQGIKIPPKGDGYDRCETMDNPTIKFTGSLLKRNEISLFLLLSDGGSPADAFQSWTDASEKMRIKYSIVNMMESVQTIGNKFEMFLEDNQPLPDYVY